METILKQKAVDLWQQNKSSYQIAAELNVSRNAVLGVIKRHREKGATLRGRIDKDGVRKVTAIQKPRPVERLFDHLEPVVGVTLMNLRHSSCCYIIGEDDATIYCGRQRARGSYCAEHYSLCYVPVKKAMQKKIERLSKAF